MSIIKNSHWPDKAANGISVCCGATYSKRISEKTNPRQTYKGIRVFDGAVGVEGLCKKTDLKHVVTKNGTITVVIRHAW